MSRRVLFVHAHPDDEASKGAATAARYVDEGVEVALITCTGGEAGDVLNPGADVAPPEQMGSIRARELAEAVAAIGFTRTYGLGYLDSGYHEDPADVPEGTFSRVPLDEPSREVAAVIRAERPHVVVTYDEDGGYPHADHIMNHLVTMRGLELAEDPDADLGDQRGAQLPPWRVPKVYASLIFPPERIRVLHAALTERGIAGEFVQRLAQRLERGAGPDPDAKVWCADHFERRDAALRAHVTQIDPDGHWFEVPRELERELYPYEAYRLLRSDVPADEARERLKEL
ncbi:MAG: PIG-L family deacetylase, partial [Nitriliruptoraceae bacterium]